MLVIQVVKMPQDMGNAQCLLNEETYHNLKIKEGKSYRIHAGQLSVSCMIEPYEAEDACIFFSDSVLNALLLFEGITLNVWMSDEDIYLGPVVGMFIPSRNFKAALEGNPFVDVIDHIKEAAVFANCLGYCFCVDNIDWENERIKGYTFIEKLNRWEYRWLPMPDVIYDRAAYLEPGEKEKAYDIREQFQIDSNIRFINSVGSLGKWPLYKNLSRYREVRPYLPETVLYKDFKDLMHMLRKHGFVFLKSSMGSAGREVLSVEKKDGKYRIDFFKGELKIVIAENPEELRKHIEEFIKEKKKRGRVKFIVQQGIRLIKYNGYNMDFRMHIVKNEEGKWFTSNYYAIHSSKDSMITNFCVGGTLNLYEKVYPHLKNMYPNIYIPTQEEMGEVTIKMGKYIEMTFGPYGEIGIDMAIDENGKIWFLEGNAKPDKYRVEGVDDMEGVSPQALAIFQYAKFLAKSRK